MVFALARIIQKKRSNHRGTESTEKTKLSKKHYVELLAVKISTQLIMLIEFLCALCASVVNNPG